jgi:hypothetical protein
MFAAIVAVLHLYRLLPPRTWVGIGPDGLININVDSLEQAAELARKLNLDDRREEQIGDLLTMSWVGTVPIDHQVAVWVMVNAARRLPPATQPVAVEQFADYSQAGAA